VSKAPRARKDGKGQAALALPPAVPPVLGFVQRILGWPHWGWTIPALLAASVWLVPHSPSDDAPDFEEPLASVGYNEVVEEIFAKFRWLVRNDPDLEGDAERAVVTLAGRARAFPEVSRFVRTSFLGDDLEANDPTRWRFEGNRVVGVNPWLHSTIGPRAQRRGWRGDITYGNPRRAEVALEAGDRRLVLTATAEQRPIDWEVSLDGETVAGGVYRHGFRFTDGQWIALVQRIGRNILVRAQRHHPTYRAVVIDPGGVPRGHATEDSITYQLRPGSRLVFQRQGDGRPSGPSYRLVGGAMPASQYRPFGSRLYDPLIEPLARPLSDVMAGAARRNRTLTDRNVPLTIDAELHSDAQRKLESKAAELLAAVRHPFRAGITIMDSTTGDLLALATFPTAETEIRSDYRAPLSWTGQNQNFVALPIGSVAKVPFAAAILSRYPGLSSLIIDSAPASGAGYPFKSVIGVEFGDEIRDTVGLSNIDFPTFIQQSSNRYAAALMMLAAAQHDPFAEDGHALAPEDQYSLSGRRRLRAPLLAFPCQQPRGRYCRRFGGNGQFISYLPAGSRPGDPGLAHWPSLLERLFDMPAAVSGQRADPFDTRIWEPLIGTWSSAARRQFAGLSPETESFGLNAIESIRNDYLSLVIGGGRSRWTNVKVAEVVSRILLDRRVSARLVDPERESRDDLFPSAIGEVATRELRAGMRRAHLSGTARPIVPGFAVQPPFELRIFAKTGTPSIASADRTPLNAELQALIELDVVGLRNGRLAVIERRPAENEADALDRLRSDRAGRPGVSTQRLIRLMQRLSRDRRRGDSALRFDADGRLTGIAPDIIDPLSDRGGAVTFMVGLYRAGDSDLLPLRALTIVINVQTRTRTAAGLGDNPALQLATHLLAANGAVSQWLSRAPVPQRSPLAGYPR
jgi:hypothetical protein